MFMNKNETINSEKRDNVMQGLDDFYEKMRKVNLFTGVL